MKIADCEAIVTCPGRNFTLVKLSTDKGMVGWGDATLNGRELAVAADVNEHLAPLLLGEDPLRIEHLWQSLFVGAYWRGGPVQNSALSGIDMALWDIFGKETGLPVYQLLGGRVRDGALAYVHATGSTPEKIAESARRYMSAGYKAVRAQLGGAGDVGYGGKAAPARVKGLPAVGLWEPTGYMRAVPPMFRHLRDALGDGVELLHDVHQRLTPIQAAGLARELEPYHLFFYEDPVPPEHKSGLALIRATSTTPIAIGELFCDIDECVEAMQARWLDYLRCDLSHVGGITAGRKLAAFAEPLGIKTAWHGPPDLSPLGHAATVHLDITTSNFGIQEWTDFDQYEWGTKVREVFRGGVTRREAWLDVPPQPGLGIEIDEAAARRFAYERSYLPVVRREDGSVHPW